mmetsp:Transcript_28803/g.68018  ORF Transcript_28803/g.68018 Transcript_28803/m.68018 type:complete len:197 (-) Transcript_28803:24-614(-)
MPVDTASTLLVLQDTRALLRQEDDANKIQEIKEINHQAHESVQQRQEKIKSIVRDLTKKVKSMETAIQMNASEENFHQAVEEIDAEKMQVERLLATKQADKADVERRLASLHRQFEELQARRDEIMHDEVKEFPREKWVQSLFMNISRVKWDYDRPESVSGFILPSNDGGNLKRFDMDPHRESDFAITKKLWDMMA